MLRTFVHPGACCCVLLEGLQPYNATKTKKTLGDRAFQVASPGLWNGLPNDIRNAKTMDVFKSLVKTHLFRKAYACYFF